MARALDRFMKDVENVTGRMGEGEAVTPAEEVATVVAAGDAGSEEDINADVNDVVGMIAIARADGIGASRCFRSLVRSSWLLAAANDPGAKPHPWIERDRDWRAVPQKMPLPSPETARQLANALSALADGLRSRVA